MPKFIDISGQRFGRLLAIERVGTDACKKPLYRLLCDCGKETIASNINVKNGSTTSCGCYRQERIVETKSPDLTGRRFTRLVVLGREASINRAWRWRCQCDCGGIRITTTTSLVKGLCHSCGCMIRERRDNPVTPADIRVRRAATTANRRAQKRASGGKFTAAQITELLKKQRGSCANCGCKLTDDNMARDHRQALANGGSNDISNIELLCRTCNSRKSAKDEIAWAQENGRLL